MTGDRCGKGTVGLIVGGRQLAPCRSSASTTYISPEVTRDKLLRLQEVTAPVIVLCVRGFLGFLGGVFLLHEFGYAQLEQVVVALALREHATSVGAGASPLAGTEASSHADHICHHSRGEEVETHQWWGYEVSLSRTEQRYTATTLSTQGR